MLDGIRLPTLSGSRLPRHADSAACLWSGVRNRTAEVPLERCEGGRSAPATIGVQRGRGVGGAGVVTSVAIQGRAVGRAWVERFRTLNAADAGGQGGVRAGGSGDEFSA